MLNKLKQHVDLAGRKLNNLLSRGILKKITNAKTATAQVSLYEGETYDGLEFPQDYGFLSSPPAGSEVIAAFFGGNRDHGTILKAFNKSYAVTTLASGEVAVYHSSGSIIHMKADGSIEHVSAVGVKFTTPQVEMTGNLIVHGDITDQTTGGNGHSIKNMRDIYNEHEHTMPGTNPPTPTQ